MRNFYLHIMLLVIIAGCQSKKTQRPVWLNENTIVKVPADSIVFEATGNNWSAILLSFTQPIPLKIKYTPAGFVLSFKNKTGITEGPAQILLTQGEQCFYFTVNLQNNSFGSITDRDYRFPKTVNTDSSLMQQRIIHRIDEWRNLMFKNNSSNYFYEEEMRLQSKAATLAAQKGKPLSSFYIQPGSATVINLISRFNKQQNVFEVTAGPLKDKYDNVVANGTNVAFIYTDGGNSHRMEAVLLNGFVTVLIPAGNKPVLLYAQINETRSQLIKLRTL